MTFRLTGRYKLIISARLQLCSMMRFMGCLWVLSLNSPLQITAILQVNGVIYDILL